MGGFTASLRLRYFGPRNLISTRAVKSEETILLNLGLGYQFNKTWSVSADIFNLMDRRDHDIEYYYTSRTTPLRRAGDADSLSPRGTCAGAVWRYGAILIRDTLRRRGVTWVSGEPKRPLPNPRALRGAPPAFQRAEGIARGV